MTRVRTTPRTALPTLAAAVGVLLAAALPRARADDEQADKSLVRPARQPAAEFRVPADEMQQIYDEVKTPFKYGIVLRPAPGQLVDCPNVFRGSDAWYMAYVVNTNKVGYETCLARSEDLLHWEPLGPILPFRKETWDCWQADGSLSLLDPQWGGSNRLQSYDGKYWMSYFGGALQGGGNPG